MRFVPARRLKAAGQLAAALPFLGMVWFPGIKKWFAHSNILHWLPPQAAARWGLGLACAVAAAAIVALGIRSLSADYLIRVSSIMRGGGAPGAKMRRLRIGKPRLVLRGQAAVCRICVRLRNDAARLAVFGGRFSR
jgi:hypothetical protein